jgi:hypothetical protein
MLDAGTCLWLTKLSILPFHLPNDVFHPPRTA